MNKWSQILRDRVGFTLVELLVVISIIGILLAIVSASFNAARQSARDKARMADLANLQQAFRLYAEENGAYPDFAGGIAVGVGETIDADVSSYFSRIPSDPLAGDDIHEYWYDSVFECDGTEYAVLMATEVEKSTNSNFETVCGVQAMIYDATFFTDSLRSIPSKFLSRHYLTKQVEAYSNYNPYSEGSYYSQSAYTDQCNFNSVAGSPSSLPVGGGSVTLTWDGTNSITSNGVSISPGGITGQPRDGSYIVNPTVTTTYTITGAPASGYIACSQTVTITVASPSPPPPPPPPPPPASSNTGDTFPNSSNADANGSYIILLN